MMLKDTLNKIRRIVNKSSKPEEIFKSIGQNVQISDMESLHNKENIVIGNNVYIGGGAYIWAIGGLEIGDNTILGPRVTIHTSNHRYYNAEYLPYDNYSYLESVKIGRNVWIGDSAMICPGVKIGDGAVIAMGSVVGGDVPNLAVVAGNPARVIKYRNKEKYEYLDNQKKYYLLEKTNNTNFKHIYIRKS